MALLTEPLSSSQAGSTCTAPRRTLMDGAIPGGEFSLQRRSGTELGYFGTTIIQHALSANIYTPANLSSARSLPLCRANDRNLFRMCELTSLRDFSIQFKKVRKQLPFTLGLWVEVGPAKKNVQWPLGIEFVQNTGRPPVVDRVPEYRSSTGV